MLVIKKRVYISVNPILFILLVIDNPPYRSVSKLTSPLCASIAKISPTSDFRHIVSFLLLLRGHPFQTQLYSNPKIMRYGLPVHTLMALKGGHFFSSTNPSSISSSSCYAMCVLTLVVLACSIPVKCKTPKLLGTITL